MEGLKKFACEKIAFAIATMYENIAKTTEESKIEANTKGILTLADAFKVISESCTEKGKVGFGND